MASGLAKSRLPRMVSWNRWASWVTTPMVAVNEAMVASRTSSPLIRMAPDAHVVEPGEELADGGLARARRARPGPPAVRARR